MSLTENMGYNFIRLLDNKSGKQWKNDFKIMKQKDLQLKIYTQQNYQLNPK